MFYPNYAEIGIIRSEPQTVDEEVVRKKISYIAERVVTKSFLKGKTIKKKTVKKIRRLEQTDERRKSLQPFMAKWNYWRQFYFDVGPNKLKTPSQMGAVENIIEMSKENNLNLDVLLACVHKAYCWGKLRPTFTTVLSRGIEFYERHYEDVLADIDKQNYEDEALE